MTGFLELCSSTARKTDSLVFPSFCDTIPVMSMTSLHRKIDLLPPTLLPTVEHFIDSLPMMYENRDDIVVHNKDLATASLSSMDFWDNPIDDEVWNDV
jgi:hypothetical protein